MYKFTPNYEIQKSKINIDTIKKQARKNIRRLAKRQGLVPILRGVFFNISV